METFESLMGLSGPSAAPVSAVMKEFYQRNFSLFLKSNTGKKLYLIDLNYCFLKTIKNFPISNTDLRYQSMPKHL